MTSYGPPNPRYSSPSAFNPSTPPAPPPKPPRDSTTPQSGAPPLPPPPPSSASAPQTLSSTTQTALPQTTSHPAPPDPSEHWLPETVLDKTTTQLTPLLQNPSLLQSLAALHPSTNPSPLLPHLASITALAQHVSSRHAELLALRQRTQQHLLHLHALERQWRQKQAEMDRELEPWSAKNLYQRLVKGEKEGEEMSRAMEESFLDGAGTVGERELGDMVRRFREGRVVVGRRREGRERWDEGRVGGWR